MKLFNFKHTCKNCDYSFLSLNLPEESYGLFIPITKKGEQAFLNSIEDQVFDELGILFDQQKTKFSWINDFNDVEIFHWIFKISCDPSPLGLVYWLGELPWCPLCGSHEIESWGETNPRRISEKHLPVVTHDRWNQLSLEQKKQAIDKAIQEYYVEEYPNWLARDKEAEEFVKNLKNKPYYKDPNSADKI